MMPIRRVRGGPGGCALVAAVIWTACAPAGLAAQADTARTAAAPDTVSREIRPLGAMWRSMLLPGWGQAVAERHTVGAIFVAWEGVAILMTVKTRGEANYLRDTESPLLESKRQEHEDWVVLWVFNHLFSGAEAFVSAHLRHFPPDLRLRAVPGGIAVSLSLPRFTHP